MFFQWQFYLILHFLSVLRVSVQKWLESVRVNDAFVEDESVAFRACGDFEMFGGRVSQEEIGVEHINVTSFVERIPDFIEEILFHDLVIQLAWSSYIEWESSDFATDFPLMCFVPVIFGPGRREFDDVISIVEFIGHVPQIIS